MSELSENIKRLRKEKGMTLEELADKVGTTKQTVHKYENDLIKDMPYGKIYAFAKALGVTPPELMGIVEIGERASTPPVITEYIKKYQGFDIDNEEKIIHIYRGLNDQGKKKLFDYAFDLMMKSWGGTNGN